MEEENELLFYYTRKPSEYKIIRQEKTRVEIQLQTVELCEQFGYRITSKEYYLQQQDEKDEKDNNNNNDNNNNDYDIVFKNDLILKSIHENQMFDSTPLLTNITINDTINNTKVKVYVDSRDCVDCAIEFIKLHPEYKNYVMLLNLANASHPGGGWKSGATAQEEQLFRRSNYFQHISDNKYDSNRQWSYPIPLYGGLYSPNVIFFRHSEENSNENGGPYALMIEPIQINCLAVAACQWPPVVPDPSRNEMILHPDYELITRQKIHTIFSIAAAKSQKVLILSAFGCGAFQNPPQHIARLFQEVLIQYQDYFHTIIFSVYTHGAAASKYNYESFLDVFGDINGNGKGCLSSTTLPSNSSQLSKEETTTVNKCIIS